MTWTATLVALLGVGLAGAAVQDEDGGNAAPEGEKVLLDGTSLDGWEHVGEGSFELEEDGSVRTEGGMGLLWYTREKFGDCVIRVEYRTRSGRDNSGVFIRIADRPEDAWFAVHNGYEVQIYDASSSGTGTGSVYTFATAKQNPTQTTAWNALEITLDGEMVYVDVNGERVTEFDASGPAPERRRDDDPERGPRPTAGYIGLQNHDPDSVVFFRKVSVRPLEK